MIRSSLDDSFQEHKRIVPGHYQSTVDEVIQFFAQGEIRSRFATALRQLYRDASRCNASEIILGGSFLTDNPLPSDLDAVVVVPAEALPSSSIRGETFGSVPLDIMFCARDDNVMRSAYIEMFSGSRRGKDLVVVSIPIGDNPVIKSVTVPDELAIFVLQQYSGRVSRTLSPRAIVPVHGLNSIGEWYPDMIEIMTRSGWMAKPFLYGRHSIRILDSRWRHQVVTSFSRHLDTLHESGVRSIGIVAHSFGSFIAMKYLLDGLEAPPFPIDSVVLSAAIVDRSLDFTRLRGKVSNVLNTIAPKHDWETRLAARLRRCDHLFGDAGATGFMSSDPILEQRPGLLLDHGIANQRNVMRELWLPFLEAHAGASQTR